MDPITIVGFASSIFTFVDFSFKLLRSFDQIHRSGDGMIQENAHTSTIIQDLQAVTKPMQVELKGSSEHEKALANLAYKCTRLSSELLKTLSSVKKTAGNPQWQAFKAAWKALLKADKIMSMEKQLSEYRAEIVLRLNILLVEQTSPVRSYLEKMELEGHTLRNETRDRMVEARAELENCLSTLQTLDQRTRRDDTEIHALLRNVQGTLNQLITRTRAMPYENCVLERLYFPSLYWREDTVSDPAPHTFHWILEDGPSNLDQSDQSDQSSSNTSRRAEVARELLIFLRERNGTFFITGKPGSGKSTLIKYLSSPENETVVNALEEWAAGSKLVYLTLYFWNSGDPLQRSLEGFYRSLLFQLLGKCPELVETAFGPETRLSANLPPRDSPFRLPELRKAFQNITSMKCTSAYRICLVLDGLDEYEGDSSHHLQLARDLKSWSQHANVKILCSARPYREFVETFSASGNAIAIHEFTQSDIQQYALSELQREAKLRRASEVSWTTELDDLIEEIAILAEGVFLWAYLVVRSLSNKIGFYETKQLRAMLIQTPKQLSTLFDTMLEKVDSISRKRGDAMLRLAAHNPFTSSLNALAYSWMDELENPEFPFFNQTTCYSAEEIDERVNQVRRELSDLTSGLLEVRRYKASMSGLFGSAPEESNEHPFFRDRVEPFHRTVKDFLLEKFPRYPSSGDDFFMTNVGLYFRIGLAEVKFSATMELFYPLSITDFSGTPLFFFWHFDTFFNQTIHFLDETDAQTHDRLFHEIQSVFEAYEKLVESSGSPQFAARPPSGLLCHSEADSVAYPGITIIRTSIQQTSLVHWLARYNEPFVQRRLETGSRVYDFDTEDKKLLLTSLGQGYEDLARNLQTHGASLAEGINVQLIQEGACSGHMVSLWLVVLRIFASFVQKLQCGTSERHKDIDKENVRRWSSVFGLDFDPRRMDLDVIFLVEENVTRPDPWSQVRKYVDENWIRGRDLHYMDLNQLLELAVSLDECLADRVQEFNQLTAPQSWKRNISGGWLFRRLAGGSDVPGYAAQVKKNHPRVDLADLKRTNFTIHGVMSNTEKLVGDFWVALE